MLDRDLISAADRNSGRLVNPGGGTWVSASPWDSDNLIEWYNTSMNKIVKLLKLQTEKDYFTTEPLSREPVSTVKVLFNPGLFEAKCLQMSKIVLNCFEI